MLRLMLKRFLIAGGIFLLCLVLIYTCAYLFVVVSESLPWFKPFMKVFTYFLCVIGSLGFVFALKMHNSDVHRQHYEYASTTQKCFKNDCLFVVKSKEHLASLIVVNCIFVPIELSIGLQANWPALSMILGALLMIVIHNVVFIALDCILWLLAFSLKGKKKTKRMPRFSKV